MSGIWRLFPLQSFSATHNSQVNHEMSQTCLPFGYLKSDIWSSFMLIKFHKVWSGFVTVFFGGCFLKIGILQWMSQSLPMMHPSLFFLKLFSMRHSHPHCVPGYEFIWFNGYIYNGFNPKIDMLWYRMTMLISPRLMKRQSRRGLGASDVFVALLSDLAIPLSRWLILELVQGCGGASKQPRKGWAKKAILAGECFTGAHNCMKSIHDTLRWTNYDKQLEPGLHRATIRIENLGSERGQFPRLVHQRVINT